MNRTSIRQSDVNEYIKSTKLIPSSNPLKLPSPDLLTGHERIDLTENPIIFPRFVYSKKIFKLRCFSHPFPIKDRKPDRLEDLQQQLLEKDEVISRLKDQLSRRPGRVVTFFLLFL